MSELTEEELLNLYGFLKKHADKLGLNDPDRIEIKKLMDHFESRLREIAWSKYQEKQGIVPRLLEEEKKETVKEV